MRKLLQQVPPLHLSAGAARPGHRRRPGAAAARAAPASRLRRGPRTSSRIASSVCPSVRCLSDTRAGCSQAHVASAKPQPGSWSAPAAPATETPSFPPAACLRRLRHRRRFSTAATAATLRSRAPGKTSSRRHDGLRHVTYGGGGTPRYTEQPANRQSRSGPGGPTHHPDGAGWPQGAPPTDGEERGQQVTLTIILDLKIPASIKKTIKAFGIRPGFFFSQYLKMCKNRPARLLPFLLVIAVLGLFSVGRPTYPITHQGALGFLFQLNKNRMPLPFTQ